MNKQAPHPHRTQERGERHVIAVPSRSYVGRAGHRQAPRLAAFDRLGVQSAQSTDALPPSLRGPLLHAYSCRLGVTEDWSFLSPESPPLHQLSPGRRRRTTRAHQGPFRAVRLQDPRGARGGARGQDSEEEPGLGWAAPGVPPPPRWAGGWGGDSGPGTAGGRMGSRYLPGGPGFPETTRGKSENPAEEEKLTLRTLG